MRYKALISVMAFLLPVMSMASGGGMMISDEHQTDSSGYAALGSKLSEYYSAMEREPLHVQAQECDFLIETASDSLVRQFVAQDIYRHYIGSPLMGAENVAVHVFDRWFSSGVVRMHDQNEFLDAQIYADFNRQSLIGQKAQPLSLQSYDSQFVDLFSASLKGTAGKEAKFSVLYFYDTDCAKCRLETIFLNALFEKNEYPVDLYAIYVGDDKQQWLSYMKDNLKSAEHLWDPSLESDFQRKYGVTQTPRMFLVDPQGLIVGRGLDAAALELMLDGIFAQKALEYGTKESEALFDGIFAMYEGKPEAAQVKGIADYISDKTLSAGDTLMFRQLAGDYLYYLATRSGEGHKEGLKYHIDRNIYSQVGVWHSQDDSLKVLGFADIMYDLLSKALPGTKVPSVKVRGQLLTSRGDKMVVKHLNKLPGKENIILFYTEGCEICNAQKAAARSMVADGGSSSKEDLSVFMVNIDVLMAKSPSLATYLMDAFDLSSLPYIIKTDSKGVILRRYMSL